jgi:ribosome-binding ATPase
MQIALIGFSKSGKTTVFNALTGAKAEVTAYVGGSDKTHRANVNVPDERLDKLCALYESDKLVYASIDYIDPVGIRRDEVGEGGALGDDMLNTIATADALLAVVRGFEDASGIDCDPLGDFEAMWLELILSDLAKVDRRLERVEAQVLRIGGEQKQQLQREAEILNRLKKALEDSKPIRMVELNEDEERLLRSFQFLTTKPLLVVVNMGEGALEEGEKLIEQMRPVTGVDEQQEAGAFFMSLCGQTEMEIAQLDEDDRALFMEEYGIEQPGRTRMIQLCYEALGLISFFTAGPTEAHAWTLRKGLPAVDAAGVIHSDLQRGFIRAQVISWDELLDAGSNAEAKKRGTLRLEGKTYVVQDGDVLEIMFNV